MPDLQAARGVSDRISGLTQALQYSFKDDALLLEALTHKSYYYENTSTCAAHNERMEFLGDSVLGLVVTKFLFSIEPQMTESIMSKIKSYVVKGQVLAEVSTELGLGDVMVIGKGEIATGGREKPSLLSNVFEAIVGAIYLDGGFDNAERFVMRMLKPRMEDAINTGRVHDYKTELQEISQLRFNALPQYRIASQSGLDHNKTFVVEVSIENSLYGRGTGSSKKQAQQRAAQDAMSRLNAKA